MTVVISSRLPEHGLAQLAYDRGLHGASRTEILKYCALIAVGKPADEARRIVQSKRHPSTLSGSRVSVRFETDLYEQLRDKFPGLTDSQLLRYITAREAEYTHEQAMAIAVVKQGRPRKENETA